jgi:hypothetical protein
MAQNTSYLEFGMMDPRMMQEYVVGSAEGSRGTSLKLPLPEDWNGRID